MQANLCRAGGPCIRRAWGQPVSKRSDNFVRKKLAGAWLPRPRGHLIFVNINIGQGYLLFLGLFQRQNFQDMFLGGC